MSGIVGLHLARRNRVERIGHIGITLYNPLTRARLVLGLLTLSNLQSIDIDTALYQTVVLLHGTLQTELLNELRPCGSNLGVRLRLGEELAYGSHVVLTRRGVGKGIVERLRELLTAQESQTLAIGELDTHLLEARLEKTLGDKRLPYGIGQHGRLLLVGLLNARLGLNLLILVVILRVVDVLAGNLTDFGVLTREAHFGLQREDERQEGYADDNRQNHAELGAKCV